jgi:DNA (cytosine-5)-methyltransferase 1
VSARGRCRIRCLAVAGIGGLKVGFERAAARAELLCASQVSAQAVLSRHSPDVPRQVDVRTLPSLPPVDVVIAAFPCQDLSQAGGTAVTTGSHSGLVGEVVRLLRRAGPRLLVLGSVRNVMVLHGGRAMRFLIDELGYRWVYR